MIERLATLPMVGDEARPYAISPDGRTVAFQWYRDGDWQIFLLDLAHGGDPRRVSHVEDACWCPLYSPDGRYLYFARDDGGSERFDIYRLPLDDGRPAGEAENLMPDTPELSPVPDFDLSPDGQTLALAVDHGISYAAATMPARPSPGASDLRVLLDHYFNDWTPRWSPDGRRLAFHTDTQGQDSAVFVYEPSSGAFRVVGGDETPVQAVLAASGPVWALDGRRVAFHGGPFEHGAIGVYDVETKSVGWVWAGDATPTAPRGHQTGGRSSSSSTRALRRACGTSTW